jgi:hypothetical protein
MGAYTAGAICIRTRSARFTRLANPCHPFNPYAITDFYCCIVGSSAHFHDFADAFVAADLACLGREGEDGPGVHHYAHVGVADAGVGSGCM